MTSLGTITGEDGFRYDLTADDLQWLARAAKYEGRNKAATMWALAQRFVELRELNPGSATYRTFRDLITRYAQPVNPIWRRDGVMCAPGGDYASADVCAPNRLAVRDRAAEDPAEAELALAYRWARGEIPNPVPRAVHYAVRRLVEPKLATGELHTLVLADDNWYASDARSARWGKDHVRVSGTGTGGLSTGLVLGLSLGGVLLVGLGAWAVQRYR